MDRLSVSPVVGSRPDSMVSCGTSTSWSTEISSRPTSCGSDALDSEATQQLGSSKLAQEQSVQYSPPGLEFPTASDGPRRPGHALMRLRRVSMPASPLPHREALSANPQIRKNPTLLAPQHRISVASARSCDSLPEETSECTFDGAASAPEARPSKIVQSAIPLPTRRIRLKSTRRQSAAPSDLCDGIDQREASTGSRPVSIAQPTTSALVASSSNGQAFVRESQTLKRSLTSNNGTSASPKSSPRKGKPSVTFSLAEPTRSIICARDFTTVKKNARMAKKDRILNEILQSERVYLSILQSIQEHFIEPLSTPRSASKAGAPDSVKPSDIFPPRTIKDIFSNFGDVYNLNKEILRRLEDSISSAAVTMPQVATSSALTSLQATSTPTASARSASIRAYQPPIMPVRRMIGSTLAPVLPFLKCYSLFVGNFGNAQAILEREEKTNQAWKTYLAAKKAQKVGNGLSLTAMLLCIVQRIPRYRLLLGDLFRFTDPSDPDYKPLRKAIIAVEEVAQHLEVSIKQHESSVAMLDLQKSFVGLDFQLIAPGRKLLKSGVLVKQGRRADEERAFFLFTDILIYADIVSAWSLPGLIGSGGHVPSPSLNSDKLPVSVIWPGPGLPVASIDGTAQYTFKQCLDLEDLTVTSAAGQVFEIRSAVQSFCLVAATPEMKHEWVAALREAKEDLLQSRRTLLTEEEEKKRSRLRRLSMPIPRPLSERSISNVSANSGSALNPASTVTSAAPSPTESAFAREMNLPGHFDDQCSLSESQQRYDSGHAGESSKETSASSWSSSYSSNTKYQNLKVYEDYSAPIWIADDRAAKCMRCGELFALWRRRHHCRLCGDVVCWACSTKSFAISSADGKGSHIIGRACDECYQNCFIHTPDAESSDPLSSSMKPSESSYSLLESLNLLRPLMTRATSLYELASNASRSREGSLDVGSQSHSRRSSQNVSSTPESVALLKSVLEG